VILKGKTLTEKIPLFCPPQTIHAKRWQQDLRELAHDAYMVYIYIKI
jgi:hypothetical protein